MPFYYLKYTWIYFPFTFPHKGNCKAHEIFTTYESCSVPIKKMIMFCFAFQTMIQKQSQSLGGFVSQSYQSNMQ